MAPAATLPGRFPPPATPSARLRLVRGVDAAEPGPSAPPDRVSDATDPRWVLAVRTAESLEGPVLVPEKRQRLLAVGGALGLSPFDTALVIAVVQDQARRGTPPRQCPAAAEPRLRHVPRPVVRPLPWRSIALVTAGVLLLEAAAVAWWWVG